MIRTRRFGVWLGTISLLVPFLGSCRRAETSGPAASKTTTLLLAAYTTPREAYRDALLPGFETAWKQKTGGAVEFRTSYQGSGAQARAIIGGFEADIAALALAPDIDKIVTEKLITQDWKARPHGGMVSNSVVVIAVRKGNPAGIKDWSDLTRSGLNVLTPDPKTSGGAMWNINAIYGAALRGHAGVPANDPAAAAELPRERFQERLDHGQGSARVDHDLREGRRRRRDHVRERGPDGAGRRRAARVRRPQIDDPDPEPGRRRGRLRRQTRHAGCRRRVPRLPGDSRRPAGLRQVRFSSRGSRRREGDRGQVSEGRGSLDDRRSRRLAQSPGGRSTVRRASGRRSSPTRALRSESGEGIGHGARGPGAGPACLRAPRGRVPGGAGDCGRPRSPISGSESRSRSRR